MSELKKTGSETNIATSVDVSNAVSGVAHLSGNETFTGTKTFNNTIYVGDGSSTNMMLTNGDIRKMTNGTVKTYSFPSTGGTLELQGHTHASIVSPDSSTGVVAANTGMVTIVGNAGVSGYLEVNSNLGSQGGSEVYISDDCVAVGGGIAQTSYKNGQIVLGGQFQNATLTLPNQTGTLATQQWVSGEHLSKNTTTDQIVKSDLSLSGSITMANGKGLDIGNSSEESTKGYVHIESTNNTTALPYIDIVKGGGQEFLELTSDSLLHTSDGGNSTLTLNFPTVTANVTKTIATTDQIPEASNPNFLISKQTEILNDPASIVLDPEIGIYYFTVGADGVLPTIDRTNMPVESTDIRLYHCTWHFQVNSSATTLTSTGITWINGAGLPTSSFAGHWIEASLWVEMWSNTLLGAVWRVS